MKFNLEEKEVPILTVFDFNNPKLEGYFPLPDDDKCNHHFSHHSLVKKKSNEKKQRTKKPLQSWQMVGHWTQLERKKYHWFLEIHHVNYQNKQLRRMDKIFKSMETFIGTRAADQCRSHHQKMEKKYKTFYRIIYNLRQIHYNTLDITEMIEDFTAHGVKCTSKLLDPFPMEIMMQEGSKVKEEPRDIHYNFFGQQKFNFTQDIGMGMLGMN